MKNDLAKHDLRGRVRSASVELTSFEQREGRSVEQPWYARAMIFDRDGNMTEHVHRNADGSELRTTYEYSDDGRLTATRNYDRAGRETAVTLYGYDAHGRLVAERFASHADARSGSYAHTEIDSSRESSTYAYDARGRKTKTQELNYSGDAGVMIGVEGTDTALAVRGAKRIVTAYDERGDAVEVKAYDDAGALVARVEIARGEEGEPLEETQYIGEVFPFGSRATGACSSAEFAGEGADAAAQRGMSEEQRAEMEAELRRVFAPGTPMGKRSYVYDAANRLIESKLTMMGMVVSHEKFVYDAAGNKSEAIAYDEHGAPRSKTIFARVYDEQGNWTEEMVSTASAQDAEFGAPTPRDVTRRAIAYYED